MTQIIIELGVVCSEMSQGSDQLSLGTCRVLVFRRLIFHTPDVNLEVRVLQKDDFREIEIPHHVLRVRVDR